MSTHIVSFN